MSMHAIFLIWLHFQLDYSVWRIMENKIRLVHKNISPPWGVPLASPWGRQAHPHPPPALLRPAGLLGAPEATAPAEQAPIAPLCQRRGLCPVRGHPPGPADWVWGPPGGVPHQGRAGGWSGHLSRRGDPHSGRRVLQGRGVCARPDELQRLPGGPGWYSGRYGDDSEEDQEEDDSDLEDEMEMFGKEVMKKFAVERSSEKTSQRTTGKSKKENARGRGWRLDWWVVDRTASWNGLEGNIKQGVIIKGTFYMDHWPHRATCFLHLFKSVLLISVPWYALNSPREHFMYWHAK